jgi:hypothetical protein
MTSKSIALLVGVCWKSSPGRQYSGAFLCLLFGFKEEITGSNPVCATFIHFLCPNHFQTVIFSCFCPVLLDLEWLCKNKTDLCWTAWYIFYLCQKLLL